MRSKEYSDFVTSTLESAIEHSKTGEDVVETGSSRRDCENTVTKPKTSRKDRSRLQGACERLVLLGDSCVSTSIKFLLKLIKDVNAYEKLLERHEQCSLDNECYTCPPLRCGTFPSGPTQCGPLKKMEEENRVLTKLLEGTVGWNSLGEAYRAVSEEKEQMGVENTNLKIEIVRLKRQLIEAKKSADKEDSVQLEGEQNE